MNKHLYGCFDHWYRGGQIYFYSDPHFADEEMKHLRKNYIGDDEQVKRINSKVGKNDTLIILGDIGDVEYVKRLRGYKVLIKGNHDAGTSNYKRSIYGSGFIQDNHLFDEVYEGPLFISEKIILSHEPILVSFALNIHGHDHSNWHTMSSHQINVCAEHIAYTPISLKQIIESGVLKGIKDIHRTTIDDAVDMAKRRKEKKI